MLAGETPRRPLPAERLAAKTKAGPATQDRARLQTPRPGTYQDSTMAIMTITDLPISRALDYKAMSAIRGAGMGDWVMYAFLPYQPPVASVLPSINFYQINYVA